MDLRSPSFEASLLYRTAPLPSIDDLIDDLKAAIEINSEGLQYIHHVDEMFTILTCETVQVLLAFSPETLPVEHFLNAGRPGAFSLSEGEILSRLTAVKAMVTVLVVDRDPAAAVTHGSLKRDLCWDVSDCLFQSSDADLVFWSDNDTLYAAKEFERACAYVSQNMADLAAAEQTEDILPPTSRIPHHFTEAPAVNAAVLASFGNPPVQLPVVAGLIQEPPRPPRLASVLSLPASIVESLGRIQQTFAPRRRVNSSALACTAATVSMTSLPNLTVLLS